MKIYTTPIWTLLHSEPGAGGTGSPPSGNEGDVIQPPTEPTPGEEVDFEALSKEFDTDRSEDIIDPPANPEPSAPAAQPPAPAQPAATQPPAQPGPAPSAQPGATSPPAAPPAATPPTPAAAPQSQAPAAQPPTQPTEPAPQPQAPAAQPVTAEAIEAAYTQYQNNILPQLERHYQMTPEQLTELEENPGAAVPKLLARVHMQSQIAAYTGVMSQMPRVVGMVMERFREVQKAEEQFHGRWPLLADDKHKKVVDATLKTFRAANPNMPTNEMIEKAGLMIMLSLGLDPSPQQPTQPTQPAAPAVPPMRPSGVGAPAPSVNTRGGNIFEQMAEEMLRNDDT